MPESINIHNDLKPTILLVDDEKNVLFSLQRLFFDEDYKLILSQSAQEGLSALKENSIQVIITDQRMPTMTGVEMLVKSREISPHSVRILLTGYTDLPAAQSAVNEGKIYSFFTKPWQDEELKLAVKRALELYYLEQKNRELLKQTRKQNLELKKWNELLNRKVKDRSQTIIQKNQELEHLNKQLSESLSRTIKVFINLLEMKSPELGGHSKRVAATARFLATELELPAPDTETVEIAALLHDIGKIGLPEKMVNTPEVRMNAEEYSLYLQHPITGQNTLNKIESLQKVGRIIRHHHENFNGSGFPDKLRGEEIPLEARIIAVTDAYDKFVHRTYINATNTLNRARSALRRIAGIELDKNIVDKLLSLISFRTAFSKIRKELRLRPFELKEDMILSRDLYTTRGTMVFPKDHRLDQADINLILDRERLEKLYSEVFIYV